MSGKLFCLLVVKRVWIQKLNQILEKTVNVNFDAFRKSHLRAIKMQNLCFSKFDFQNFSFECLLMCLVCLFIDFPVFPTWMIFFEWRAFAVFIVCIRNNFFKKCSLLLFKLSTRVTWPCSEPPRPLWFLITSHSVQNKQTKYQKVTALLCLWFFRSFVLHSKICQMRSTNWITAALSQPQH